jgi:HEAT repeat protein
MTTGVGEPGLATPPLIAALTDPAAEVRAAAAEALGVIGGEAIMTGSVGDAAQMAATGLIRALKDREPAVQVAAIHALVRIVGAKGAAGSIDLKGIIAALAATLGDRDDQVRLVTLDALGWCGPLGPADPPAELVAALEDRSARVRAAAVKALACFPCPLDPWLPSLLRSLERDESQVRLACRVAFGRSTPPAFSAAAIPALVTALGSGSRLVRLSAASALEPHARDPRVAAAVVPALLSLLRGPVELDPGGNPLEWGFSMNINAARMLGRLAPGTATAGEAVAGLAEAVRTGDPSWRPLAIGSLREFGPAAEPAIPALLQALRDALARKDEAFSFEGQAAAGALAKIAPGTRSSGVAVAALTEVMRSSHPSWWSWAAEALGEFGPAAEPAIPALIRALHQARAGKDERPSYGFAVARALGRIAPGTKSADAALSALTEALQSPSEARLWAISALSAFGEKATGVIPQLRAWQKEPDYQLKAAATSALRAIEGARSGSRRGGTDQSGEGGSREGP